MWVKGGVTINRTGTPFIKFSRTNTAAQQIRQESGYVRVSNDAASNTVAAFLHTGLATGLGGIVAPDNAVLDVNKVAGSDACIRARTGTTAAGTTEKQLLMSFNGANTFTHSIASRHNSAADSGNQLDFYLWDFGVDATTAIGTKQVLAIKHAEMEFGPADSDTKTLSLLHTTANAGVTWDGVVIENNRPSLSLYIQKKYLTANQEVVVPSDSSMIVLDEFEVRSGASLELSTNSELFVMPITGEPC